MDFTSYDCQVCGVACGSRFQCLGRCGALFFCSMQHAKAGRHDEASCKRMQAQLKRKLSFDSFPTWPSSEEEDKLCLPNEPLMSKHAPRIVTSPLPSMPVSWLELYSLCNLSLHSPAALTLHPVLTLASFIHSLPSDREKSLHVLFLGPRIELGHLEMFDELANLCCSLSLQSIYIHFVGDSVPVNWASLLISAPGTNPEIHLSFYSGFFHDQWEDLSTKINRDPVIVQSKTIAFLPNAGLPAYPQWIPTVKLLVSLSIPFMVTDYNEEALVLSLDLLNETCGLERTEINLNPFREPARRKQGGNALPSSSNGFSISMTDYTGAA